MREDATPYQTVEFTQHQPDPMLKNITMLVYALLGVSVVVGVTALVAIIINYLKKEDMQGTFMQSHCRWQIRTFWFALLWSALGWLTLAIWIGGVILTANAIWVVYRVVKGWLRLNDGKAMYT